MQELKPEYKEIVNIVSASLDPLPIKVIAERLGYKPKASHYKLAQQLAYLKTLGVLKSHRVNQSTMVYSKNNLGSLEPVPIKHMTAEEAVAFAEANIDFFKEAMEEARAPKLSRLAN